MFIQTETTPNPNTLKFLPNMEINSAEPVGFHKGEDCRISPLARILFTIENVKSVFYGRDFISVTKSDEAVWDFIKPEILVNIMEYLASGKKVLIESTQTASSEDDSDIVQQIKELIETRVRPAVAQDGGDIVFRAYNEGIVQLELHGACSGCPSSSVTLKSGIESMLKHYIPEIIAVEAVQ